MLKKNASRKSFLTKGMSVVVLAALVVLLAMPSPVAAKTAHQPGEKPQAKVTVGVPTLLSPVNDLKTQKRKPLITGVTENETKVAVYVDGTYNGQAKVANDPSGIANFSYTPFLDLTFGTHQIQVRAEAGKERSGLSELVTIAIERPYVAPTLFEPVVNDITTPDQPFIVGVALDKSLVKVYIDGKLDGEIMTSDDDSGTGHFSYKPFLPLNPDKDHLVYAVAYDQMGKESPYSNVVGFKVEPNRPKKAAVAEVVEEEVAKDETAEETEQTTGNESQEKANTEEGKVLGETEEEKATTDETAPEDTNTEAVAEETNNDNANTNSNEDSGDKKSNTSIIIWVVILVIVIILIVLSLRGGSDEGSQGEFKNKDQSDDKNQKNEPFKEGEDQNKGDTGNLPPPPPSSSSY